MNGWKSARSFSSEPRPANPRAGGSGGSGAGGVRMNKEELIAKMMLICADHLYSLEAYEDFPDVPKQDVDEAKELVQEMLRKVAKQKAAK